MLALGFVMLMALIIQKPNNDLNYLSQHKEQWHLTLLIGLKLNTLVINCK